MKIEYYVVKWGCPRCGKILKRENTLFMTWLLILLLPISIIYGIYRLIVWIHSKKTTSIPSVGNPFKICPKCGLKVRVKDKKLYEELTQEKKYIYDNRSVFRWCYITITMTIVFGLMGLLVFSPEPVELVIGCISIFVAIVSLIVSLGLNKKCKKIFCDFKRMDFRRNENSWQGFQNFI